MNRMVSSSRRGYVLLLALFVLALAAAAMAGVCRMSLEKAVQAGRAEADLRRRWAVISCRAVLLPKAEDILRGGTNSVAEVRRSVRLNGHSITLVFGDEQAKANVNMLYAQSGLSGAEHEVRAIVATAGGGVPVELRPIPGRGKSFGTPDAADDDPPAFESFAQVLGQTSPQQLLAIRRTASSLTSSMTCWGDGSLNLRRASNESVRAILAGHLAAGEISRLLHAREKNPKAQIEEFLDGLDMPPARR